MKQPLITEAHLGFFNVVLYNIPMHFILYSHREYFRLLMSGLSSNNSLFCGPYLCRTAAHNTALLERKEYFCVGECIAMSLLYGGPGPHFFSNTAADYILGIPFSSSDKIINDIPDYEISQKVKRVIILTLHLC